MKKTFLFLLTFFLMVSASMAQVSLVPKAGITIANVALDNKVDGQKSRIGFAGGLGINFGLTSDQFLSLQPEILYVQKGFAAKNSGVVDYDYKYKLNYLEVPVLLKIGFGSDIVKAYVNLGPSVGYLLNGRIKGNGDFGEFVSGDIDQSIDFTSSETQDPTKLHANRIELGANFGGGIGFALGASQFFVDVRYNAGLTDFNKDSKSKNQVFYLMGGFQIPITQ